jgi:hypothetical protein
MMQSGGGGGGGGGGGVSSDDGGEYTNGADNDGPPNRAGTYTYADPVVTQTSSAAHGVQGFTTYRLSVRMKGLAKDLYSLVGSQKGALSLPPAFQVKSPFGANLCGVNPQFLQFKPEATFDSWLTVGIVNGDHDSSIQSAGLTQLFSSWNEKHGLHSNNGGVFWVSERFKNTPPCKNAHCIWMSFSYRKGCLKTLTIDGPQENDGEPLGRGREDAAAGGGGAADGQNRLCEIRTAPFHMYVCTGNVTRIADYHRVCTGSGIHCDHGSCGKHNQLRHLEGRPHALRHWWLQPFWRWPLKERNHSARCPGQLVGRHRSPVPALACLCLVAIRGPVRQAGLANRSVEMNVMSHAQFTCEMPWIMKK